MSILALLQLTSNWQSIVQLDNRMQKLKALLILMRYCYFMVHHPTTRVITRCITMQLKILQGTLAMQLCRFPIGARVQCNAFVIIISAAVQNISISTQIVCIWPWTRIQCPQESITFSLSLLVNRWIAIGLVGHCPGVLLWWLTHHFHYHASR